MTAKSEDSAAAKRLEKVSFHSNPKEGQRQRTLKRPHNCTHFPCQQADAQSSPSQASVVREPRTSRCINWIRERKKNQRSNCQHPLGHRKSKAISKPSPSASLTTLKPLTVWIIRNWKAPDEMGIPDTCPASGEARGSSGSRLPRRHWRLLSAAPRLASRPQARPPEPPHGGSLSPDHSGQSASLPAPQHPCSRSVARLTGSCPFAGLLHVC